MIIIIDFKKYFINYQSVKYVQNDAIVNVLIIY